MPVDSLAKTLQLKDYLQFIPVADPNNKTIKVIGVVDDIQDEPSAATDPGLVHVKYLDADCNLWDEWRNPTPADVIIMRGTTGNAP